MTLRTVWKLGLVAS